MKKLRLIGDLHADHDAINDVLQSCHIHQPPLWRIGHWHRSIQTQIGNTHFKCLNINENEIFEW